MTDPSDLFFSTERNGRTVPETARLEIEETDNLIRLTAIVPVHGDEQFYEYTVHRLKPIRDPNEHPFRDESDVVEQVRKSVIALAYACIDSLSVQKRHSGRPFTAY